MLQITVAIEILVGMPGGYAPQAANELEKTGQDI
jgi:hypothetical protein